MTMPHRKSILLVAPSAYILGGLAVWIDYLIPGLQRRQWDVTLGLVSGPRYHRVSSYLDAYPIRNVIPIHCQCSTSYGRVLAVRKAISRVEPDIVLTANIPQAIRAAGLERSQGRALKAVMSCHGIQEDLFADMRLLHAELDAVVCTNRLLCRLSEELGQVDPERIFYSACGTSVPKSIPDESKNDHFTVGFSGRIEQPYKRVFDLIEVAKALRQISPDFKILVAGDGPERQRFKEEIIKCGLENQFDLLGAVAAGGMYKRFYSRIDALLVTSSSETGPIVIWEAMAAGVPVVTSRYIGSGAEGILGHGQNCLMFNVADCNQAARHLVNLKDAALRSTLRTTGFRTASTLLTHDISVANWDRHLQRVLLQSSPSETVAAEAVSGRGRLDRVLGTRLASFIRARTGRLPPDTGPGGEWPHTMAGTSMSEDDFLALAEKSDCVAKASNPCAR